MEEFVRKLNLLNGVRAQRMTLRLPDKKRSRPDGFLLDRETEGLTLWRSL